WQVLLLTGAREWERVRDRGVGGECAGVRMLPYLDDLAQAYAAADLVVARAGASTLAELGATGTPAVLVPYPHATGARQMKNAQEMRARGVARIVPDDQLDGPRLVLEIRAALEADVAQHMREAARRDARDDVPGRLFARIAQLAARG
ncbi:MAG: UDP-N-acetylglucosamine--N-acetylmuramyl-(pentapeptide) pyrophosphoryl-undecaprenol N-acetylglucosamine transferase, partial [Candidatus Eremiobacteraeota bacterium]|nr:UDP-N-acetylglucosamine--N-acetylmuramyl-(pentapeptide) pyrophosphoryl-undecaprenol N-acetylglucosamine transferase [Candidatus Eremiobacteraeota bacterium]